MENISEWVFRVCDQLMEANLLWPDHPTRLRILFSDDVEEAEKEEGGEEVEHPVAAKIGTAGEELEESVAGEAEAEAIGDGPGEWNGGDGEEGGDADLRVAPLNGAEAGEHERADED